MRVRLRLFGTLKRHAPDGAAGRGTVFLDLPEGATVLQLIMHLGIPYGEHEGQIVAAVNDRETAHDRVLREGDAVSLFEPLAGG